MPKKRSADSLLTKLENMEVGSEIFTDKSNGFVSDCINTTVKRNTGRKYTQCSVYTHEGPTYTCLADFKRIICIKRLS